MASSNWYQGPASVTFNSVDLGEVKGGVSVTVSREIAELTADKYGSTPVRVHEKGVRIEVTLRLSEWDKAVLEAAFPSGSTDTVNTKITLDGEYTDLTSNAAQLTITPTQADHALRKLDIPKAICIGDVPIAWSADDQQVFELTFLALYDESTGKVADVYYGA